VHDAALIDTTGHDKTDASVEVTLEAGTHPVDMIVRLAGNDSVPALELNELPDAPKKSRKPAKQKRKSK